MYHNFAFNNQFGLNRSEKSDQKLFVRFTNAANLGDTPTYLTEPKNKHLFGIII
jgi:hypothetical protein